MFYSLHILPRAEDDFECFFRYIGERSLEGAWRWRQAFEVGVERLKENPFIYGIAPENEHFDFELRQLLFKTRYGRTYRAIYRVDDNQVSILRICGPGQAPLRPNEFSFR